MEKISKSFVVVNPAEVNAFLGENLGLVDFLPEAAEQIGKHFPGDELLLDVATDPESGENELFAYIKTALPVKEALEKLDEFDEAWFLDQSETSIGAFNFNLRFA